LTASVGERRRTAARQGGGPRLRETIENLHARVEEAKQQGWLGEIAGLKVSLAAANDKLTAMNRLTERHGVAHLGMPDFRPAAGRTS
jgi:hypothetical protein